MRWWLLRLTVKMLDFLQLTVNFFPLWLTEILKINFHCLNKLKINLYCFQTLLRSSDHSGMNII